MSSIFSPSVWRPHLLSCQTSCGSVSRPPHRVICDQMSSLSPLLTCQRKCGAAPWSSHCLILCQVSPFPPLLASAFISPRFSICMLAFALGKVSARVSTVPQSPHRKMSLNLCGSPLILELYIACRLVLWPPHHLVCRHVCQPPPWIYSRLPITRIFKGNQKKFEM